MAAVTEDVLHGIVDTIVREVTPARIVLFGSYVKGQFGRDSDLDLLIVEDEPFTLGRSRFEEINRIRGALRDSPVPLDILVYSRDEVEKWKDTINHIVWHAFREGQTLYERD